MDIISLTKRKIRKTARVRLDADVAERLANLESNIKAYANVDAALDDAINESIKQVIDTAEGQFLSLESSGELIERKKHSHRESKKDTSHLVNNE